jgi:delta 1-pyrroline-5-carboxylate dehydrogenase
VQRPKGRTRPVTAIAPSPAGGPRYLHRFATERTVSIDTTAAGGNASLLALEDEA